MLVKLKFGVNLTNIFRAAFAPTFLCHKSTNLKCEYKKLCGKLLYEKAGQKMLVKLIPNMTSLDWKSSNV
jgi:hypothetical protein